MEQACQEEGYYVGTDHGCWWLLSDQCQWKETGLIIDILPRREWQDCSVGMGKC